VGIVRGDSQNQFAATINAPLLAADSLWTGDNSRTEVQLSGGTVVDFSEDVQVQFADLDFGHRELQIANGAVELSVLREGDTPPRIDTPSVSVQAETPGRYRIAVTNDGQTEITVRQGRAEIITARGQQELLSGITLVAQGSFSEPSILQVASIPYDDFDRFVNDRNVAFQNAFNDVYVNGNIEGVSDLDSYGHWVYDPPYGHVWVPSNEPAGWAPYSEGRWVWEGDYAWTWVGDEPWGWAPYHYGRWLYTPDYGWCWYPPARSVIVAEEPMWQPALVGFVGFTVGNVSFGIGSGNIGWIPLAPYEPYYPWYMSRHQAHDENTYIVNGSVRSQYRNANAPGAVSGVTREQFGLGQFAHPIRVSPVNVAHAVVMRGTIPIVPSSSNLGFAQRPAPVFAGHDAVWKTTRVFAGRVPIVQRAPFEEQRKSLASVVRSKPIVTSPAQWSASNGKAPAPVGSLLLFPGTVRNTAPTNRIPQVPVIVHGPPTTRGAETEPHLARPPSSRFGIVSPQTPSGDAGHVGPAGEVAPHRIPIQAQGSSGASGWQGNRITPHPGPPTVQPQQTKIKSVSTPKASPSPKPKVYQLYQQQGQ
jgi:hypothetical protein